MLRRKNVKIKVDVASKKNKAIFYNTLIAVSAVVFVVSGVLLAKFLIVEPKQNENLYENLQEVFCTTNEEGETKPDFENLLKVNNEIKGWIKVKNTPIDYPVLYSNKYIDHNYKKDYSKYGSIFLDTKCVLENKPDNILLHGHSMRNGSMFAGILKWTDLDFYKSTPTFTFDTPEQEGKWKVFAVFRTNTLEEHGKLFDYLVYKFPSNKSKLEFIYQCRVRSVINVPVDITDDDQLITLSTCSYEMKDFRTVIVARKVREGEDPSVNVDTASYNNCPLFPEAYRKKYRLGMPCVTNFEDALKNGKIDWYKPSEPKNENPPAEKNLDIAGEKA